MPGHEEGWEGGQQPSHSLLDSCCLYRTWLAKPWQHLDSKAPAEPQNTSGGAFPRASAAAGCSVEPPPSGAFAPFCEMPKVGSKDPWPAVACCGLPWPTLGQLTTKTMSAQDPGRVGDGAGGGPSACLPRLSPPGPQVWPGPCLVKEGSRASPSKFKCLLCPSAPWP